MWGSARLYSSTAYTPSTLPVSHYLADSSTYTHITSTRGMSDPSGSMIQSLFDAALDNYEKQTGMKLIDHPLARQLEDCNSVESITAVLQDQARAFTVFRRDDGKLMKPLKNVVHVLHTLSTSLVRRAGLRLQAFI